MAKLPGAAMAAFFLVGSSLAPAQEEPAQEDMETVLVTGEQPGPGLWKVSRDGHVMWVFGTIGEVPDTIRWRTKEIEARIAGSQEVLYPGWPSAGLDISAFQALTLVPLAFKAARNPNGAMLKDVFSPDDYATWLRLKQKYLGDDDDIEKYRPMVAEEKLNSAVGRKNALKNVRMTWVDEVVRKAAKKHKVRLHYLPAVERNIRIEKPRAILKAARNIDLAEGECVGRNFARIEKADARGLLKFDVASVNAWATGDLDTFRGNAAARGDPELAREDCQTAALNAVVSSQSGESDNELSRGLDLIKQQEKLFAEAGAEAYLNWMAAAEKALANNTSTFAVLPMNMVLDPTGWLSKLEEKGYSVEYSQELRSTTENAGQGPVSE
jgi:hypothetical protein